MKTHCKQRITASLKMNSPKIFQPVTIIIGGEFPRGIVRHFAGQAYAVNLWLALPVSCVAGITSGLIGIGGGVLNVPFMVLVLGTPIDIAVGSSAFMVGLTAAGGFVGHLVSGHWDWQTSLVLAMAVFVGGQIGARATIGLNKHILEKGFGWFLLLIAVLMLIETMK